MITKSEAVAALSSKRCVHQQIVEDRVDDAIVRYDGGPVRAYFAADVADRVLQEVVQKYRGAGWSVSVGSVEEDGPHAAVKYIELS